MRGLLVVNPHATTTSPRVTDVIVKALAGELDLEVVQTQAPGHARELGARARRENLDIVCTLGGDGTINETVNGMLGEGPGPNVPRLLAVPGGSANVFARSLGLPGDPVEAAGLLLEAVRENRTRTIGLGTAEAMDEHGSLLPRRWFLANVGVGIDAEIIASMEQQRAAGRSATPARYLTTTLRQYFLRTDRRDPALVIELGDGESLEGVFLAIVQNTSPWTFLGSVPINPSPRASFETGLDLFAVRRMGVAATVHAATRMLTGSQKGSTRRSITALHDLAGLRIRAARPTHLQIDGEGLGPVARVDLEAVASALTAFA